MSEYIKKEDVLQAIAGLLNVVEQIDSADVVEVIRCKDCKYYVPISARIGECKDTRMNSTYMNYCGYAERKTNDE